MLTKLELYKKVIPLAHLGVWERNIEKNEGYWNSVVREIFEVGPDYYADLEKTIGFYSDAAALRKLIDNAIKTGQPENGDFQITTTRGNIKWIKVYIKAGFEDGKCTVIYGTIEDITAQINLINSLAEQQEQFHHAFDYAPIGMALVSTRGDWIKVNNMLCQMLGRKEQQLLKETFQNITHPDDLDKDLQQMHQLLAGQITNYQMDKRYLDESGRIIWASLHVTLVRDQQGQPLYFVSQIQDITERKKHLDRLQADIEERKLLERERRQALEIINAQNERLMNFAHIVSHNLRSHAGNIQMLTDMILKEEDVNEKNELIGMLGINAVNLLQTLLHLNEVVDVNAAGAENLKRLNLVKEIRKIGTVLSGSLKQASAELSVKVASDIEIEYDPAYLESILLNLLSNGIKYRNPKRPLKIFIRAYTNDGRLILEIEDNGLGIDLDLYGQKIFGMYKTFHGNKDAHGIGLFLVKNQVEAMGGNITVESSLGEGTIFRVEFKKTAD